MDNIIGITTPRRLRLPTADECYDKTESAIIETLRRHEAWLRECQSRLLGTTRPPPPGPQGLRAGTGVGKTRAMAWAVNTTWVGVLMLMKNHMLAEEFAKKVGEEAFLYFGRNDVESSAAHCYQIEKAKHLGVRRRLIQPLLCQSCAHGLRTMNDRYRDSLAFGSDQARERAATGLDRVEKKAKDMGIDLVKTDPCAWLNHQQEALHRRIVVAAADAYGPTLAAYDGEQRLIVVDEAATLARSWLAGVDDVREWEQRWADEQRRLTATKAEREFALRNSLDPEPIHKAIQEIERDLADLRNGAVFLTEFRGWLAISLATPGEHQPTETLRDSAKNLEAMRTVQDGAIAWERATVRPVDGSPMAVPLRAATDLANAIKRGTIYASDGMAHVATLTGLGEALIDGKSHMLFLDATMPRALQNAILVLGGEVVGATPGQNAKIVLYPDRAHLRGGFNHPEHGPARLRKEKQRLSLAKKILEDETGETPATITHQPLADGDDGWWGSHETGTDRFNGRHLLIFGDPLLPPPALRANYEADRALALAAGCPLGEWPQWSDARERHLIRVSESIGLVSKIAVPTDPHLRDWMLDFYSARFIQAVGRNRAARSHRILHVHVWAGLPIDWRTLGIEPEIRPDPKEAGPRRGGLRPNPHNAARRDEFLDRLIEDFQVLLNAQRLPGRRNVDNMRGAPINPQRFARDREIALRMALEVLDRDLARWLADHPKASPWMVNIASSFLDS